MIIDKIGKGIVLREIIALHTTFITLLMPLAGYYIYNRGNAMSFLWRRFMPIQEQLYFNYALPAITGFVFVLCFPIINAGRSDEGEKLKLRIGQIKNILKGNYKLGISLLIIGSLTPLFVGFLPVSLQYIINLFYFSSFAGFLYVFYSESFPFKKLILFLFGLFIVITSLRGGMFTIIAYMGMTLFSFFFLGNKTSIFKKVGFFLMAITLLFVIQTVKPTYRYMLWKKNYEGNKALLFANLTIQKLSNTKELLSADVFFPIYYRTNQGYNLALVQKRFPNIKPFDNGSYLTYLIASSFIPRLLWPDKPEAGGVANMKYYTGVTIRGWSTNVGPVGEAYASFGSTGGIIYMLFLGFFIRYAYAYVIGLSQNIPLLLLWIPMLFYQITFSAENDTLQILNSLFKSGVFIYVLFKIYPSIFIPKLNNEIKETGIKQLA